MLAFMWIALLASMLAFVLPIASIVTPVLALLARTMMGILRAGASLPSIDVGTSILARIGLSCLIALCIGLFYAVPLMTWRKTQRRLIVNVRQLEPLHRDAKGMVRALSSSSENEEGDSLP